MTKSQAIENLCNIIINQNLDFSDIMTDIIQKTNKIKIKHNNSKIHKLNESISNLRKEIKSLKGDNNNDND